MSWMDSWSRPSKHAAVPPPLYLTEGEHVPYCHTCGRVISSRKSQSKGTAVKKYCSDRCRSHKPKATDRAIEDKIVALLNDEEDSGVEGTGAKDRAIKGDRRIMVTCDEIEEIVFGSQYDPAKTFGRRKNRASRVIGAEDDEWKSVDMVEIDSSNSGRFEPNTKTPKAGGNLRVRRAQVDSDVNGSIGGEKGRAERQEESLEDANKRREGQIRADQREMVRRAARRGVVFGFVVDHRSSLGASKASQDTSKQSHRTNVNDSISTPTRRKCEALMGGIVVEPSFAKGDWAIRWRDT